MPAISDMHAAEDCLAHPCAGLAVAAVLREEAETLPADWPEVHSGMIRAAALVDLGWRS